jgi:glutathione reductase (NADPH)
MPKKFDLIVIGTGSAGATVAKKCRSEGLSVAIIDEKPFGGTCAQRGCDPKKVLVGFANAIEQVHRFQGLGLAGKTHINWTEMMAFKDTFTDPVPKNREENFSSQGIVSFHGTAAFTSPNEIQVGKDTLSGEKILIATGASATKLPFEGQEHLIDNEDFLELKSLPKKIAFVGGGYISMEFSHIANRAGAEVTIINDGERILKNFDPYLVDLLEKQSKELGINIIHNSRATGVMKKDDGFILKYKQNENHKEITADLIVHGAGRSPNTKRLNLESANVAYDKKGITVNSFGQSVSNPQVYAAGDVANGGLPLTPVASFEAHIVASNILKENSKKEDYPPIPSVVFTIPHLASVGLTEEKAKEKGIKYKIKCQETSGWFMAKRLNENFSGHKILLSEDEKYILGAHLLGHGVEEIINIFAQAIHHKTEVNEIKKMIFAYPSVSSNISSML